jgi:acetolactate synthase-1/2/3 large subunit
MDSVPMVIITGQVGRSFIGTDAFQEIDIFGITLPIVKHSYVVRDTKDMSRIVAAAFFIAKYGRPGPVLIDVPKDVGLEQCDYLPVEPGNINLLGCPPILNNNKKRIEQAANLIRQSNQPLLYVGGGAVISGAYKEIAELSDYLQIPVATTLMGTPSFKSLFKKICSSFEPILTLSNRFVKTDFPDISMMFTNAEPACKVE